MKKIAVKKLAFICVFAVMAMVLMSASAFANHSEECCTEISIAEAEKLFMSGAEFGEDAVLTLDFDGGHYCDADESIEQIMPLDDGHNSGNMVMENRVEPTCTENGSFDIVVYCTKCGEELSRVNVTVNSPGHMIGDDVEENRVEATETEDGSYDMVTYCAICNKELARKSYKIPAYCHVPGVGFVEDATNVKATCEEDGGYCIIVPCKICGGELSHDRVIIPATGHKPGEEVIENRVNATEKSDGKYDLVVYCTVCDKELSRVTHIVPALCHELGEKIIENVIEPTCEEAGSYEEVAYCNICGEEGCRHLIIVPALGHTPSEPVIGNAVASTCTEAGSHEIETFCTVCKTELSSEVVSFPARGHNWGEWEITREATNEQAGEKVHTCLVCGEAETKLIPALNNGGEVDCSKDDSCPVYPFADAKISAWYHDGVHFGIENGLMQGYPDGTFRPEIATTRAMIVQILWRYEGCPDVDYHMSFEDVSEGAWYANAVRWCASLGIVSGYSDEIFAPDKPITRQEMVTILWRYARFKGYDVSAKTSIAEFSDAHSVSSWAKDAMQWAYGCGVIQGVDRGDETLIAAGENTTRAQAASFIFRYFERFGN